MCTVLRSETYELPDTGDLRPMTPEALYRIDCARLMYEAIIWRKPFRVSEDGAVSMYGPWVKYCETEDICLVARAQLFHADYVEEFSNEDFYTVSISQGTCTCSVRISSNMCLSDTLKVPLITVVAGLQPVQASVFLAHALPSRLPQ